SSQARPSWTSLDAARPSLAIERAQACGSGAEAEIGGDRDSTRRQRLGKRFSSRKAEAGGCDYDDRHSLIFRPKKTDRRAGRQISLPSNLLSEGVRRRRRPHVVWSGLR